jgi:hypothetical protein
MKSQISKINRAKRRRMRLWSRIVARSRVWGCDPWTHDPDQMSSMLDSQPVRRECLA